MINVLIPAIIMLIASYNFIQQHQEHKVPGWSIAVYWLFVTIYWLVRTCAK